VIVLDVSLGGWMIQGPSGHWIEILGMLFLGLIYMFAVILSFLFAQVSALSGIGDALATFMARSMYDWSRKRQPLLKTSSPTLAGTHARSGYLYFYLWRAFLRGLLGWRVSDSRKFLAPAKPRLRADRCAYPTCKVLFLYGGDKGGIELHDRRWEASVRERTDGSRVVRFDRCGHWLLTEAPGEVNREMEAFLA
jgi:pimeloyl-ACP methyl ester carboxylesterase